MAHLTDIWIGMETRNTSGAGTDSSIFISIITDNIEQLRHTFPDSAQEDQEKGQANLYRVRVTDNDISSELFTNNSISVGIEGADEWRPRHIVVWGRNDDELVIPLAIATDIVGSLSTDKKEGIRSLRIPLVELGNSSQQINRLLMLMVTAGASDAGTDSPISLRITSGDRLVVDFDIPDTPQLDQDRLQANMYFVPVRSPFTRGSLSTDSITLRILGNDKWKPNQFFLFGLDDAEGRPEILVPLVHILRWNPVVLGSLSTDPSEGKRFVTLPPL